MAHAIFKLVHVPGTLAKQRLHIRTFADADLMYTFLGRQESNEWRSCAEWRPEYANFKKGVYAYAGGQWHNVRTLDAGLLSHI
jgi:hypothetical protein